METDAKKIIQEMVRRIVDQVQPEKIILFGSHARGTAGVDSDVDLLIVFKSGDDRRKKAVEIYKRLADMDLPKDIVVATQQELDDYRDIPGTIVRPALAEGQLLYDRVA